MCAYKNNDVQLFSEIQHVLDGVEHVSKEVLLALGNAKGPNRGPGQGNFFGPALTLPRLVKPG